MEEEPSPYTDRQQDRLGTECTHVIQELKSPI